MLPPSHTHPPGGPDHSSNPSYATVESHLRQQRIKLQIKLHWVGKVAQLLLEETDHAPSLLVGTIVKRALQYINE